MFLEKEHLAIRPDARLRKQLFGANVLRHPAKQSLYQLIHLLDRAVTEWGVPSGGLLVDPFGGSGSAILACSPIYGGMFVVTCELASHFIKLQEQAWQHFQCTIVQDCYDTPAGDYVALHGDSRNLAQVMVDAGAQLPEADLIITSPSYGGSEAVDRRKKQNSTIAVNHGSNAHRQGYVGSTKAPMIPRLGAEYRTHGLSRNSQLSALQQDYGQIERMPVPMTPRWGGSHAFGPHSQLSTMQVDYADLIVTSPPYQDALNSSTDQRKRRQLNAVESGHDDFLKSVGPHSQVSQINSYDTRSENIGNQHGKTYLASMRLVWQQCALILRPGGILCCITRDCVRDGKRVPVGQQNRELIEAAGLEYLETEEWQLTQESFWRILQRRKAEAQGKVPVMIDSEQVQIFRKPEVAK